MCPHTKARHTQPQLLLYISKVRPSDLLLSKHCNDMQPFYNLHAHPTVTTSSQCGARRQIRSCRTHARRPPCRRSCCLLPRPHWPCRLRRRSRRWAPHLPPRHRREPHLSLRDRRAPHLPRRPRPGASSGGPPACCIPGGCGAMLGGPAPPRLPYVPPEPQRGSRKRVPSPGARGCRAARLLPEHGSWPCGICRGCLPSLSARRCPIARLLSGSASACSLDKHTPCPFFDTTGRISGRCAHGTYPTLPRPLYKHGLW